MYNIKIHSNTAEIVVFPTMDSYKDWYELLHGNMTANTSWDFMSTISTSQYVRTIPLRQYMRGQSWI